MSIKRLFDAVERRSYIGRRVVALVLPISDRPRVTSRCAGKIGLREPGEHTSGPNLASRDNVAHEHNLYTILETPPWIILLCRRLLDTDLGATFAVPFLRKLTELGYVEGETIIIERRSADGKPERLGAAEVPHGSRVSRRAHSC
jgi:hypothetical protein